MDAHIHEALCAVHELLDKYEKTLIPRRERIATAALQGILSRVSGMESDLALYAVRSADALIRELDK